jgi:hypothetical protein
MAAESEGCRAEAQRAKADFTRKLTADCGSASQPAFLISDFRFQDIVSV